MPAHVNRWSTVASLLLSMTLASITLAQETIIRINAGGPQVTAGGVQWAEDRYYTNGTHFVGPADWDITGTNLDPIYRSERFASEHLGTFNYSIPVPVDGRYEVRLHFAETYFGAPDGGEGGANQRVFNIDIQQGAQIIENLDIYAEVGALTALYRSFTVDVTGGELTLHFTPTQDRPKISGIEVFLLEPAAGDDPAAEVSETADQVTMEQPAVMSEPEEVVVAPPPARPDVAWQRFAVQPLEPGGMGGTVLVRDLGEAGTVLVIAVSGAQPGALYLSSLHEGSCETPEERRSSLNDVRGATGMSTTVVDIAFDELIDGGFALSIYRNEQQRVACGELSLLGIP